MALCCFTKYANQVKDSLYKWILPLTTTFDFQRECAAEGADRKIGNVSNLGVDQLVSEIKAFLNRKEGSWRAPFVY